MKRCPECRRDYSDETLNFCLDDGAALLDGPGSEFRASDLPTAVLPADQIPRKGATLVQPEGSTKIFSAGHPATTASVPGRERFPIWVIIAVVPIALVAASASYWFFGNRGIDRQPPPQPKLTQITFADGIEEFPAWSPDGTKVAYSGEV